MINNGSLHGIENFFPNTLVNELSSSHFALLSELYKLVPYAPIISFS